MCSPGPQLKGYPTNGFVNLERNHLIQLFNQSLMRALKQRSAFSWHGIVE